MKHVDYYFTINKKFFRYYGTISTSSYYKINGNLSKLTKCLDSNGIS